MDEKNLKKVSRLQLLEMLVEQGKEIERLKCELNEANEKLNNRAILMNEAGNIAEASLRLNGIFTNAQSAANQYLESIRLMEERQKKYCRRIESEVDALIEKKLQETKKRCLDMERKTRELCERMLKEAERKARSGEVDYEEEK